MSRYELNRLADKLYRIRFDLSNDVDRLMRANRDADAGELQNVLDQLEFLTSTIRPPSSL